MGFSWPQGPYVVRNDWKSPGMVTAAAWQLSQFRK